MRIGLAGPALLWAIALDVASSVAQTPAASPEAPPAVSEPSGPRLTLRGFSNVDFAVHEEGLPDTFALGQFDTFMTSALSEDVSVLAEVVFEFGEDNAAVLDVERVQVKWAPSDGFALTAGRMHTLLGYWNQTFHHGAWFQTTAGRPEMYLFEDDGGILPVHMVGVQASGTLHTAPVDWKYSLSLVNGRGRIPDEIPNVQDATDGKAVNAWIGIAPSAVPGLQFGASAYLDRLPPDGVARLSTVRERILGGYLLYLRNGVEVLAEASHVHHRWEGRDFGTWGLYAQGGFRSGRWMPYYRFDRVEVAAEDPFLSPLDVTVHTLGLRIDAQEWVALKGEYHLRREDGTDLHSARLQAAFAF
jgi:hypothetical protein